MKLSPTRGEVWSINFDPSIGSETKKIRPAVVVNDPNIGRLPIRMVVPITEWDPRYAIHPWFVYLPATSANGLIKNSGADAFSTKSISVQRFIRRLGRV